MKILTGLFRNKKPPQMPSSLNDLKARQTVTITDFKNPALRALLARMGLLSGDTVEIAAKNSGTMVVKKGNLKLALGKDITESIGVKIK